MDRRYRFELNEGEKLAICNALHMAQDEARKLARREAAMGMSMRLVRDQERYAELLKALFFRFNNAEAVREEEEGSREAEEEGSREE